MNKFAKYVLLDLLYVLDNFGSLDMHFEKFKNKILQKTTKNVFCGTGGGLRMLQTGPQLLGFFLRLPLHMFLLFDFRPIIS